MANFCSRFGTVSRFSERNARARARARRDRRNRRDGRDTQRPVQPKIHPEILSRRSVIDKIQESGLGETGLERSRSRGSRSIKSLRARGDSAGEARGPFHQLGPFLGRNCETAAEERREEEGSGKRALRQHRLRAIADSSNRVHILNAGCSRHSAAAWRYPLAVRFERLRRYIRNDVPASVVSTSRRSASFLSAMLSSLPLSFFFFSFFRFFAGW